MLTRYVPFDLSAADAAQDVLELTADEGKTIALVGFHIGKMGTTSERLELTIKRFDTDSTSGSAPVTGGGTITPTKVEDSSAEVGFAAEAGNETQCSGGTVAAQTFVQEAFDPSAGYDFVPPSEAEAPRARDGKRLVISIGAAPGAANQNITGYAVVKVSQ